MNLKHKITIVIPHIDDEIYSAMTVFQYAAHKKVGINVVLCSWGPSQLNRSHVYDSIKQILGVDIDLITLCSFEDSRSSIADLRSLVSELDPIFNQSELIYIPEISQNQDHEFVNKACMAALRYRDTLQPHHSVYAYGYIYNQDEITPNIYKELSQEFLNKKLECLKLLDTVDSIQKDKVNSDDAVITQHKLSGYKCNKLYAETFRLVRSWV